MTFPCRQSGSVRKNGTDLTYLRKEICHGERWLSMVSGTPFQEVSLSIEISPMPAILAPCAVRTSTSRHFRATCLIVHVFDVSLSVAGISLGRIRWTLSGPSFIYPQQFCVLIQSEEKNDGHPAQEIRLQLGRYRH